MKGMTGYLGRMMTILLSGAMVLTAVPKTVYAGMIGEESDLVPIDPDSIALNEFEDEKADKTFRGEDFWVDDCGYRILSDDTVSFANGLRLETPKVIIPSKVIYEGKEYTVVSIGGAAFSAEQPDSLECKNTWLEEVVIPDTVTRTEEEIGHDWVYHGSFSDCTELSKVTLSDTFEIIGSLSFCGCTKLEQIDIPDSLTEIHHNAFDGAGLTSINIPAKCEDISGINFARKLKEINIDKGNKEYYSVDGVVFRFYLMEPDTHIEHHNILVQYPSAKEDVIYNVPDGTKEIGFNSFVENYNIKTINLPESITKEGLFEGHDLDGIPHTYNVFNRSSIEEINIDPDNEFFVSINGVLYSKDLKALVAYPPAKKDKHFFIPSTIERLGGFNENCFLEELYIPARVNTLLDMSTMQMKNLKKIVFAKNSQLERITDYLTLGNSEITSICIPASVKTFSGVQTFCGSKIATIYFAKGAIWNAVEKKGPACNFSELSNIKVYGHGTDNGLPELINEVKKEKPNIEYIDVETNEVPLLGITFDDTIVKLDRGEEKNIAVCEYPYWMDDVELKYETSDPSIATVDNLGNVKAIEYGECYITVTALDGSGEYSRCKIEVKEKKPASTISEIQINETKLELPQKATTVLNATVSPLDADPNSIIWTSSDDAMVKVNPDLNSIKGNSIDVILTAGNKEGTATITASAGDVTATVEVTVINPVRFDKHEITLVSLPDSRDTIAATVKGKDYSVDTLEWSSSDENVATVANGVVTAVEGLNETSTATITAQTPDGKYKDTCLVTVTAAEQVEAPVASINSGVVEFGTTIALTCQTVEANIYCTIDGTVPSFDPLGNPAGTTRLYTGGLRIIEDTVIKAIALKEGFKESDVVEYNYTVEKLPDPVDPGNPDKRKTALNIVVVEGGKILDTNLAKNKEDGKAYVIAIGDNTIAAINNKGVIRGKKAGITTATVTKKDITYTFSITVLKAGFTAKSYKVNTGDKIMPVFNSGVVEITSYKSSKPDIAQVYPTTDGLYVAAFKKGATRITAECNGKKYIATVNVYDPYINGVNTLLLNNKTATLSVKNGYGKTIWETDNSSVVTVKNGKIKGVSKGSATITAINNGRTMTNVIKVYNVPRFDLKLYETRVDTPIDVVLTRDSDYGNPTYSVSNRKLAIIDENGKLTPIKKGTVTVTAAIDGKKYKTKVKIKGM